MSNTMMFFVKDGMILRANLWGQSVFKVLFVVELSNVFFL